MIQIPYEEIVEKIKEKTNLSYVDIEEKVKEKLEALSGLISKEGAAHILANEFGVKIFDMSGKLKIKNILVGLRNVEAVGKVVAIFGVNEFTTKNGIKNKVGSFIIGDETGKIRVVLWGSMAEKLAELSKDTIVRIENAYVRENRGEKEVHLGDSSKLIINPEGESVGIIKESSTERKAIKDLKEGENTEISGFIVQVFDLKFYEVCPECNKKVTRHDEGFICNTHSLVIPKYNYVENVFIDDGTENIRVVFFSDAFEKLAGKTREEVLNLRDNAADFEALKEEIIGSQKKIKGRVVKNAMFDRIEIIANDVSDLNPEEEIKRVG